MYYFCSVLIQDNNNIGTVLATCQTESRCGHDLLPDATEKRRYMTYIFNIRSQLLKGS